jgi:hypothetical protein
LTDFLRFSIDASLERTLVVYADRMQEFSSVTASSYDAESLAPLLTEKAAEGWDVISIVAAGTNIVAYLSRADAAATTDSDAAVADTADEAPADEPEATPAAEPAAEATLPGGDAPYVPAETAITADAPAEVADATASVDDAAATAAAAADEPAGWAAAPDNDLADLAAQVGAEDTTAETSDADAGISGGIAAAGVAGAAVAAGAVGDAGDAVGGLADQAADAAGDAAATDVTAEAADTATEAAAEAPAAEAPAAEAPAAESTVPAGWYADPSGRYELRYWDGSAWTEHVSRAGQQFTDPPVA